MLTAVLGMQWGDEGKGKLTHLLARDADVVVRFNGGPNAGHTVFDRGVKFGIHLIPVGAFHPGVMSLLASGMVIDFTILREEVDTVTAHRGEAPRLLIAQNAHLILPYHPMLEDLEGSGARIGTTRRGIGPAYRDKAARAGIRAGDLLAPDRLTERVAHRLELLRYAWPNAPQIAELSAERLTAGLLEAASPLLSSIGDAPAAIRDAIASGQEILFEGAQGALLDIDFGAYPMVTSSSTTFAGLGNAIGVPAAPVDRRLGITKAYTTRVGGGSFPTELTGGLGTWLQEQGGEFGVTTGRPRRCGWLDLVALRHAAALNAPTHLAVTKLDILSGMRELKLCTGYRLDGDALDRFPADDALLARCEPIYETVPGWSEPIGEARELSDLPKAARAYLDRISAGVGVPIGIVSIGPSPEETIICGF
jgi:adenylosuccinate synthase